MKIAFISGSPKVKDSASDYILQELRVFLQGESNSISEWRLRKPQLSTEEMKQLPECDAIVLAFPLYVDGIPSHLLNCLIQLENYLPTVKEKDICVYCLVNCGFYEGHQNKIALEMMENWCLRAGVKWGQGIGIGAGGMLTATKNVPIGYGPKKNLGKALKQLADNISKCASEENMYITANFPRILYKFSAEMGWKQMVKANGLKLKDLYLKK